MQYNEYCFTFDLEHSTQVSQSDQNESIRMGAAASVQMFERFGLVSVRNTAKQRTTIMYNRKLRQ